MLSLSCIIRRRFAMGALAAAVCFAGTATAGVLTPGGVLNPAPAEPDPVGGSVIASRTEPFNAGLFLGTLTSQVISGDTSNPYGGLTFTYLLSNDASSVTSLGRLTVLGYTGWLTDASYNSTSVGVPPSIIDRPAALGEVVGFTFSGSETAPIQPGNASRLLVIQTNATDYRTTIANIIDGSVTQAPTYAPIPAPGAAAIAGLAGVMLAGRRSRRTI